MASRSLDEEFRHFIATVYPDPPEIESDQYKQLHDAFFGGCLVAYSSDRDFSGDLEREHQHIHAREHSSCHKWHH